MEILNELLDRLYDTKFLIRWGGITLLCTIIFEGNRYNSRGRFFYCASAYRDYVGGSSQERILNVAHFLIAFHGEFFIFIQLALDDVQLIRLADFIKKGQAWQERNSPL